MLKNLLVISAVMLALASVSGCSKKVLDERNAQIDNGKIFEKDANSPFSGTLTNISQHDILDEQDGFRTVRELSYAAYGSGNIAPLWSSSHTFCDVSVTNGDLDGKATCKVEQSDSVVSEFNFDKGILNGAFNANNFNSPDKKLIEGEFKDGKPDGELKIYNLSGKTAVEIHYADGVRDGKTKVYNGNGDLTTELNYKAGKGDGAQTLYSPDGKIKVDEYTMSEGLKDGEEIQHDPSTGKKIAQATWSQGKLDGSYKTWSPEGELTADRTYKDNNVVSDQTPKVASQEPAPAEAATSAAAAVSGPTASAAAPDATTNSSCVDGWVNAFHKEQGDDTPISEDQLGEWQEWCKQGKVAPAK